MEGKVYCIRHAESTYNKVLQDGLSRGEQEAKFKVNPSYTDPEITELGFQQIEASRPYVQGLSIDKVYVSPLRRALLTCRGLFQCHPSCPSIVVLPDITENLFSSCDFSKNMTGIDPEFPEFDWSALRSDSEYWIFDIVDNDQTREIKRSHDRSNWAEISCSYLSGHDDRLESLTELETRAAGMRRRLKADMQSGLTVAIVSHWVFIKHFTMQADGQFANLANTEVRDITQIIKDH
jgi:broad specificity phosphatase PhoE